jgi:hypothetical protein
MGWDFVFFAVFVRANEHLVSNNTEKPTVKN